MRNYKHLTLFLLLLFFSNINYAEEINNFADTDWIFDNVSKIDVYGNSNEDTLKLLRSNNEHINISFTDHDTIIIQNNISQNQVVCNKPYSVRLETPLEYLYSKDTVDLYNTILSKQNEAFANRIKIIKTGLNDSCLIPYEELIENNERLFVIDKFYLVFFKKITKSSHKQQSNIDKSNINITDNQHTLATELNENCKEISSSSFTESYICPYPHQTINDIYFKIVKIDEHNRPFLRKSLSNKDETYYIAQSDVTVKYVWENKNKLIVSLDFAGGTTTLIFEEKNDTTTLIYKSESDG